MFGLNIRRPELAGLIACEKDDAPGFLRVAFKHNALPPEPSWPRRSYPARPAERGPNLTTTLCNQMAAKPKYRNDSLTL